ncbi:hypothetical protein N2W52_001965 [Clostridium perfringens]|nr:hypothetical protein [Clostridium perfringens]MDK0982982.1 hypothetical protein [Clostridium perfringens]
MLVIQTNELEYDFQSRVLEIKEGITWEEFKDIVIHNKKEKNEIISHSTAQGKLINDYFELDGIIKNDDIHLEVIFKHKLTKQYFFCKFYLVHNDNLIIVDRRDVV